MASKLFFIALTIPGAVPNFKSTNRRNAVVTLTVSCSGGFLSRYWTNTASFSLMDASSEPSVSTLKKLAFVNFFSSFWARSALIYFRKVLQLILLRYEWPIFTPCFASSFKSSGYLARGSSSLAMKYATSNLTFAFARSPACILVMPVAMSCWPPSLVSFMDSALSAPHWPLSSAKGRSIALLWGSPRAWSSALLNLRLVEPVKAQVLEKFFIPFTLSAKCLQTEQFKLVTFPAASALIISHWFPK